MLYCFRCGNVAAILELDEHLDRDFTIFEAAPQVNCSSAYLLTFWDWFEEDFSQINLTLHDFLKKRIQNLFFIFYKYYIICIWYTPVYNII